MSDVLFKLIQIDENTTDDMFPIGTIAVQKYPNPDWDVRWDYDPRVKVDRGSWVGNYEWWGLDVLWGWYALIPVEVGEEWSARQTNSDGSTRGRTHFGRDQEKARKYCEVVTEDIVEKRIVTDWEEV